ncbi:hypothetical protein M0R45_035176 [Rubus argutus]|uniref:Uncharacterized protein n=1 Tax=Rubus argutus TaxID=59490 RepID=A0AAW1VU23_RUBAR
MANFNPTTVTISPWQLHTKPAKPPQQFIQENTIITNSPMAAVPHLYLQIMTEAPNNTKKSEPVLTFNHHNSILTATNTQFIDHHKAGSSLAGAALLSSARHQSSWPQPCLHLPQAPLSSLSPPRHLRRAFVLNLFAAASCAPAPFHISNDTVSARRRDKLNSSSPVRRRCLFLMTVAFPHHRPRITGPSPCHCRALPRPPSPPLIELASLSALQQPSIPFPAPPNSCSPLFGDAVAAASLLPSHCEPQTQSADAARKKN